MPRKQKGYSIWKSGQQWYVGFSHNGRRYQKPVGSLSLCETEADSKARSIAEESRRQLQRAGRKREPQNPITAYEAHLRDLSDSHHANHARFLGRFNAFLGDVDIEAITKHDVEAWRDWLLEQDKNDGKPGTLSPKTVKEHIDWLAAIYNFSQLTNPCKGVERPRKTHAERVESLEHFSPEEMDLLVKTCREKTPRFTNGLILFAYTGCRVAEIQNLVDADINHRAKSITVTGKGDKTRTLRLSGASEPAWEALQAQKRDYPRTDGFIFPRSPTWARKGMDRLRIHTGIDPCHPHMLRHTLASMALFHFNPPWEISFLAKWLGHSDVNTTFKIYSHWIAPEAPSSYEL